MAVSDLGKRQHKLPAWQMTGGDAEHQRLIAEETEAGVFVNGSAPLFPINPAFPSLVRHRRWRGLFTMPGIPEPGVGAVGLDQLVVRAELGDLAILEHRDPVRAVCGV